VVTLHVSYTVLEANLDMAKNKGTSLWNFSSNTGLWVCLKMRVLPSGTLPQTLDLENFASVRQLSQVLSA